MKLIQKNWSGQSGQSLHGALSRAFALGFVGLVGLGFLAAPQISQAQANVSEVKEFAPMVPEQLAPIALTSGVTQAMTYNEAVGAFHAGDVSGAIDAFFDLATTQNDADAQYALAAIAEAGEHVDKDMRQAIFWYEKAADQGHVFAQAALGAHLILAQHVIADYPRAFSLLMSAGEKGHAKSLFNAAVMLEREMVARQPDLDAIDLYRRAAQGGYIQAQVGLGTRLAQSERDPNAWVEAYQWLSLAAMAEHPELSASARLARDQLAPKLTPDQLAAGQQLAREAWSNVAGVPVAASQKPTVKPRDAAGLKPSVKSSPAPTSALVTDDTPKDTQTPPTPKDNKGKGSAR